MALTSFIFAYLHVQLGGQVVRKYVQSDGRECAMSIVEQTSCQILPWVRWSWI